MLYSFHGVLHGEADVDLCINLTKDRENEEGERAVKGGSCHTPHHGG